MTREVVEDKMHQTPSDGSSTEEESYDGDGNKYRNRKEDRYIDYYTVPRGRPISEGRLVRKGIHLSSQDKDSRKKEPTSWMRNGGTRSGSSGAKALTYHRGDDLSDSTSADNKPPRPERSNGIGSRRFSSEEKHQQRSRRLPSSERSYQGANGGAVANAIHRRYHTVDRNTRLSRYGQYILCLAYMYIIMSVWGNRLKI